jgi:hypothetical protein
MERAEIAELFYNALIISKDLEKLDRFLSARVQWTLSAADPHTLGEESPPNAITFSGKQGCRQLALYFQESLKVFSGDLTGWCFDPLVGCGPLSKRKSKRRYRHGRGR